MPPERAIVSESDLVLPALRALADNTETGLTTSELQPILREALNPKGPDLVLLEGRPDDRFSQKVRNLRSHARLERDELATFEDDHFHITDNGRQFVDEFDGVDESFVEQGFDEIGKKSALTPTKPLVFVEEGTQAKVSTSIRRRSKRLRQYALRKFEQEEGKIVCVACGFEGSTAYGEPGKGLIDIHHTKPISLVGTTLKPLSEAVRDLAPLCPTCHRMVHRKAGEILSIEELQRLILDS